MDNQLKELLFLPPTDLESSWLISEKIDHMLGLRVNSIEEDLLQRARNLLPHGNHKTWGPGLHQRNQTWVGLYPQTFLTPYSEIKQMLEMLQLSAGQRLVDLGAGYGRMGMMLGFFYPEVEFIGYELVEERVKEGNRVLELLELPTRLIQQDLTTNQFMLPAADVFFIYDYGEVSHIRHSLKQIESIAESKAIRVIARGKGSRSLIEHEHPWLCQINPPIHQERFSIYRLN
jgi:hypothetical protein